MTFNFSNVQNLVGFFGLKFSVLNIFFFFFFNIYLFLAVLSLHYCTVFSLVVARGGYSLVAGHRFSLQWLLCCRARAVGCACFRGCGSRAVERGAQHCGSRAVERGAQHCGSRALEGGAQGLWRTGVVALWHVDLPGPEIKPLFPASAGGF